MTGVEGYVESAASGLMTGIQAFCALKGLPPVDFPDITAMGALAHYISNPAVTDFQPMNELRHHASLGKTGAQEKIPE
jgi:methylenetetrahydrofolate--tRNA-(uracil-5-)-methyltransferase